MQTCQPAGRKHDSRTHRPTTDGHTVRQLATCEVALYDSFRRHPSSLSDPFSYGFPAVIVAITIIVSEVMSSSTRYGTENFCWLTHQDGFTFAFVGPVLVVIFLNVVFLSIAMYQVGWWWCVSVDGVCGLVVFVG